MNKKAGALSIIVWTVSVFVIVFFLAGWMYMHNVLTNILINIPAQSNLVNISQNAQQVIVPVNNAMNGLTYISFILITMLAFGILIENFYIRKHPILFMVHILIVVLAIIGAIYISNTYETLMSGNILSDTLITFTASSYIILYLPYWVSIIGIFGLVLLVINAVRDPAISARGGI